MKFGALAWLTAALLTPALSIGAEPCPPHTPLRFTQAKGKVKQSLEVRYVDARTISFMLDKSGTCSRHEQGTATLKPSTSLGAETDENEAGEMVAVREYVFAKSDHCTMYVRIDEGQWKQATVKESSQCSNRCRISEKAMPLVPPLP